MLDVGKLFDSDFAKKLTSDSTEYAKKLISKKGKDRLKPSKREEYIHQVLDSFSELNRIVENLNMAEIFLRSYSVSKSWRDNYDHNHYVTYHYEMWVLNSIRLYERLLILIDSVYWLEVDHRDVTFKTISEHKKLERTETLAVLNKVHGALSTLQGVKNSVFHRYLYTDDDLAQISEYNFLARNSTGKAQAQLSHFANLKMRYLYLPKKRKEIHTNNEQLLIAVDAIFKTLLNQYELERDQRADS